MRRRRQSLFEDLIDVAAMLPWWAGVLLAAVVYLVLHAMATSQNAPPPGDIKSLGGLAVRQLWIVLATFGQYLLPVAFLAGAGISAYKRFRREQLHAEVAGAPSRGALEAMHWREFESLVGEMFRRKGFAVVERGGNGPDGGVDLELRIGQDKYLVQCKQWKAQKVGVAVVRELFGVMAAEGAVGGFVVASGSFTEEACAFAEGRSIELVDTRTLLSLVAQTAGAREAKADAAVPRSPLCPECAAGMVMRKATKGDRAGQSFWGCPRYPACRGRRPA